MQLPSYLQLEPVGQCNLRCQMCPIQFRRDGPPHGPPAFMAFETYIGLIDQFDRLEHLHLQGLGEPLMHPRFFDMVRFAVERSVRVTTNTNLTLLNERRAAEMATCGIDHVYISLDAASAPVYESIRIRGHFERVIGNIRRLTEARAVAGQGPDVSLVMVLMRRNLGELPELVRLAADLGIAELNVQQLCHDFGESTLPAHYAPMRNFVASEVLTGVAQEYIESVFGEARATAAQHGIQLRLPRIEGRSFAPETPGRERCDWPWTGAYVSYDGQAMPCCMISTPDRGSLGRIDERPLLDIWDGDDYRAFRAALSSQRPPEVCAACAVYNGTF